MHKSKLGIIIGSLLAIMLGSGFYLYSNYASNADKTNNIVEIVQDGKVLHRIDLNQVSEKQIITIEYQGHYNKIEIERDKIQIIDADCPDKLCVKMGYLKHNAPPLVCLPHHLVIQYADNSLDTNAN